MPPACGRACKACVCPLATRLLARQAARQHAPVVAPAAVAPARAHARLRGARGGVACAAWQRVHDAASGKFYFWNTETQATAWELPAEQAEAAPAAAPATAAAVALDDAALSNDDLVQLFVDYILTPQAKFDYPSPSAEFMELVETHRYAIYERADCLMLHLNAIIDATPAGGPPIQRSAGAAPLVEQAASRRQSAAVAGIAMFSDENMRWNTDVVLTRKEALESVRARLSNPGLRDANPAF